MRSTTPVSSCMGLSLVWYFFWKTVLFRKRLPDNPSLCNHIPLQHVILVLYWITMPSLCTEAPREIIQYIKWARIMVPIEKYYRMVNGIIQWEIVVVMTIPLIFLSYFKPCPLFLVFKLKFCSYYLEWCVDILRTVHISHTCWCWQQRHRHKMITGMIFFYRIIF